MAITNHLTDYAGRTVARRLRRSMPWIAAVIALATVARSIRRKGIVGGTLDTALDYVPYLGAVKNAVEAGRGRDFIRDKQLAGSRPA